MSNLKEYNIGLDIGVASVGWAITDENGELVKRQNKNLWGSRTFSEANVAKQRRLFRNTRRRLERRKERINMLQSLLQDDMEREYPNFFQRLRNSFLIYNDKDKNIFGDNYNLFDDINLTDRGYYGKFPTIYHLRNELVHNQEKQDFRLVYLALHHIIKYRGNFLYEGDFKNNPEVVKDSLNNIIVFLKDTYDIDCEMDKMNDMLNALKSKNIFKKDKYDELKKYFSVDKDNKAVLDNMLKAIIGYKFDLSKIFELNTSKKISFAQAISDEDELINELNENADIYENMKNVYSWFVLQNIIDIEDGKPSNISNSFINKYEKHKKDLRTLKDIYKQYYPNEYDNMFRKNLANNYVSFRGKSLKNQELAKCDLDEFYKEIENKIKNLPDSYIQKEKILKDLQSDNFLQKLNTTDNGAIPHQLHLEELKKIIDNQSKYYKTLSENREKIISIFEFKIPYYIGPLSISSDAFSWVKRKNNEKIRPWNINEVVDKNLTAEEFIKRMTNKCTYLINEDVMPKNSLLYSKFCVLNELNNISIITAEKNNCHLDKKTKQGIIDSIFLRKKSVNKNDIIEYLKNNGIPCETISGLVDDNKFNSSLSSYIDMKNVFKENYTTRNFDMYENLIYWITIFEDKGILEDKITTTYKDLSLDVVKQLLKLNYSGWSRLSKQLLIGEKSYQNESIMDILENTKMNFMQIINNPELGFDKILEKQLEKHSDKKFNYKEDIANLTTSPANKRAIWQSVAIVEELTHVMKKAPKRIYIEFARNEEEKKLKDTRVKKLLKSYENFLERNDEVYKNLKSVQNDKNISEKMYLYFMQNGQCMYSGEQIHLDELGNYEIDHIIPQSYMKDDSFDNKCLVLRNENQRKKDNLLLADSIINKRTVYWKMLLDNGLISQTKFYRLIKRSILETDSQKVNFVNRQLVETRQITKHVTNLLKNHYHDTEVYAIRAGVVSGIRSKFELYKNRSVNDYHHAHDAYLLCVTGNVIEKNLKYKDEYQYGEYVKKYFKENKDPDTIKKGYGALVGLVAKHIEPAKIKKILYYKDCYLSKMLEEGTGEFYNQTICKKKENLIKRKENLPTEIYGGYTNINKAYMCIFAYKDVKGKQRYNLVGIPIKVATDIKNKKVTLEQYIKNEILKNEKYDNFKIIKEKILLKQQYIDDDGNIMRLASESEVNVDIPLIIDSNLAKFIYLINQDLAKLDEEDKKYIETNYENAFDALLENLEKHYKIFESISQKIKCKKVEFMALNDTDKNTVLNGMINLMKTGQGNLKILGMGDRTGRISGKTFNEKNLLQITFIDKSVTGIYERRYRIDGMENDTNK